MSIHTSVMDETPPSSDVRADAERWFARLKAADCSAAERMAFQRWRAVPEHAAAYAATEQLWGQIGRLSGRAQIAQLSEQILTETSRIGIARWPIALAASVALAVVGVATVTLLQPTEMAASQYASALGEQKTVTLADGSVLILNSATEVDAHISDDRRRLALHRGEAVFNVAHDTQRPFVVEAGNGEVTALGTRFQIRNEGEQVTVTLLEGSVAVDRRSADEHVELVPGDQVAFDGNTARMTRRTVDPDVVTSWTTGRLRFRSTPLAEAIGEINRYSQTQIRIADPTLAVIPISGTFDIGDSASVVSALEAMLPIHSRASSETEVLLTRRDLTESTP